MNGENNMTITITNIPYCIHCYNTSNDVLYRALSNEVLMSQPNVLHHLHNPVNNINVIIYK